MQRLTQFTTLVTVLTIFPACIDGSECATSFKLGPYCLGETGGEDPTEFYYDENGIALLIDPDSERAQDLVNSGRFHPHGRGACEDIVYQWTEFGEFQSESVTVACCADRGCDWTAGDSQTQFRICYPDASAWGLDGLVGAIAPIEEWGAPNCETLTPFGWQYDYLYQVPCVHGVVCEEHLEQCGCACGVDFTSCFDVDYWLDATYFGDGALLQAGWESACTGVAYWWDAQAYGTGGWVGNSCEFNQPGPGDVPFVVPPSVQEFKSLASCDDGICYVNERVIELVMNHPSMFDGNLLDNSSADVVMIRACGDLCEYMGGFAEMQISSVGMEDQAPTPAALLSALSEFKEFGSTVIETDSGTIVFVNTAIEG